MNSDAAIAHAYAELQKLSMRRIRVTSLLIRMQRRAAEKVRKQNEAIVLLGANLKPSTTES